MALNELKQRGLIKVPSNLDSKFKYYEATSQLRMKIRPYFMKEKDDVFGLRGTIGIKWATTELFTCCSIWKRLTPINSFSTAVERFIDNVYSNANIVKMEKKEKERFHYHIQGFYVIIDGLNLVNEWVNRIRSAKRSFILFLFFSEQSLSLSTAISIQRLIKGLSHYTHLPDEIQLMAKSVNVTENLKLVDEQLSSIVTQLDQRE